MTVRELIQELLLSKCSMDANVIIKKELDYNIWVNSDLIISEIDSDTITLSFDFPIEKFEIKRKKT